MTKSMSHSHDPSKYESSVECCSETNPGLTFIILRPSFKRRSMLIGQVRELGRNLQFLEAGQGISDRLESYYIHAQIDEMYLRWGLVEVRGMEIDGETITIESLIEKGPERLSREIIDRIKDQCSLTEHERKN
jgi:hypothetical protein